MGRYDPLADEPSSLLERLRRLGGPAWFLIAVNILLVAGVASSVALRLAAPPTGPLGPERTDPHLTRIETPAGPYAWSVPLPPVAGSQAVRLVSVEAVGGRGLVVETVTVSETGLAGPGEEPNGFALVPGRLYELRLAIRPTGALGGIRSLRTRYAFGGRGYEIRLMESLDFVRSP